MRKLPPLPQVQCRPLSVPPLTAASTARPSMLAAPRLRQRTAHCRGANVGGSCSSTGNLVGSRCRFCRLGAFPSNAPLHGGRRVATAAMLAGALLRCRVRRMKASAQGAACVPSPSQCVAATLDDSFRTVDSTKAFVQRDEGLPASQSLQVEEFLARQRQQPDCDASAAGSEKPFPYVMLDVRSPGEYDQGHIPGAVNLPLLSNVDRADVGTLYKQVGSGEAFDLALERVQPSLQRLLDKVALVCGCGCPGKDMPRGRSLLIYCLRGGMRSRSMAKFLACHGYNVCLLAGGYKAFKTWAMETLAMPRRLCIIGGATGSGKTEVLCELQSMGAQVIDLEGLAHHKGSVFGHLGEGPQPSSEHFRNMLAVRWSRLDPDRFAFVEDEESRIGTVHLPALIYKQMREAPVVVRLVVPFEVRVQRSLNVYGAYGAAKLAPPVSRFRKNMGNRRTDELLQHLQRGELRPVCEAALTWYDRIYAHHLQRDRAVESIVEVPVPLLDSRRAAADVLAAVMPLESQRSKSTLKSGAHGSGVAQASSSRVVEASCYCGHVVVRVRGDPLAVSICHCATCRVLSGAPFVASALFRGNRVDVRCGRARRECGDGRIGGDGRTLFDPVTNHGCDNSGRSSSTCDRDDEEPEEPVLIGMRSSRQVTRQRCGVCFAPVFADLRGRVAVPLSLLADAVREATGTKALPLAWRPQHHLHYEARSIDVDDNLVKFAGRAGGKVWCDKADGSSSVAPSTGEDLALVEKL